MSSPPLQQQAEAKPDNLTRALIKEMAMDIGKSTTAYIQVMYPEAGTAASSTFLLSVRNHVYNEIMASIEVSETGAIVSRLAERKAWRQKWLAMWRNIRSRGQPAKSIKCEKCGASPYSRDDLAKWKLLHWCHQGQGPDDE